MKNATITDFYEDAEQTKLKKAFSVDYRRLIKEDFDKEGWSFLGFKETYDANIPINMKGFVEPEKFYILDFFPNGERTYTYCAHYDSEDPKDCIFRYGKRFFQIKVSEEYLQKFINTESFKNDSLKSIILDVITHDKYYDQQNWHSIPFMLFDDKENFSKKLNNALKLRLKSEIKKGLITEKKAEGIKNILSKITTKKLKLLEFYYQLNPSQMTEEYRQYICEKAIADARKDKCRKEKTKKNKKIVATEYNENTIENDTTKEITPNSETKTETTKNDKTVG